MAFQIIRHAFRMIFGNFGQALRVSIGPYVLLILGYLAAFMVAGGMGGIPEFAPDQGQVTQGAGGIFVLVVLLLIPFTLFVMAWVAVSWHRFILLEEYAGVLPAVAGRPIWPYVGRTLLYSLLMMLVAVPLFFIVGLLASPFISVDTPVSVIGPGLLVFVIVGAVLTYVWFRIALALPSVAVGHPIRMADAWAASGAMRGTIFGVAVLLMVLTGVGGVLSDALYAVSPLVGALAEIAVQWVTLMLGVSILTTLYGHLIEKRPLIG